MGRVGNRRRRAHPEADLQRSVLRWLHAAHPDLAALTFHTPNERGTRTLAENRRLKGLGVRGGIPDLVCIARRGKYAGLALELKAGKNKPTPAQREWLDAFAGQGWLSAWANTLETAQAAFEMLARAG